MVDADGVTVVVDTGGVTVVFICGCTIVVVEVLVDIVGRSSEEVDSIYVGGVISLFLPPPNTFMPTKIPTMAPMTAKAPIGMDPAGLC